MSGGPDHDGVSGWRRASRLARPVLALLVGGAVWEIVVRALDLPAWQLPAPSAILASPADCARLTGRSGSPSPSRR